MSRVLAGDLALEVPAGYRVQVLALRGPSDEGASKEPLFVRSLVVARERVPSSTSAARYAERQLALMRGGANDVRLVCTRSFEQHGTAHPVVELRQLGPGGVLLASLSAYVRRGDEIITLSASHLAGAPFEAARREFYEVLASLDAAHGEPALGAPATHQHT